MTAIQGAVPADSRGGRAWRLASSAARVLLGLLLVANSPVGTLIRVPASSPSGDALMAALWHSPYIMVLTKLVELSVGLLLLSDRWVPLALVIFSPVLVNIVCFQASFSPRILPLGGVLVLCSAVTGWENRAAYRPLFRPASRESATRSCASTGPRRTR
jgi:hypothetical protein